MISFKICNGVYNYYSIIPEILRKFTNVTTILCRISFKFKYFFYPSLNRFSISANLENDLALFCSASMVSGVVTSFNSMPFDIAKTRIQNLKLEGKVPNVLSVILEIARKEGIKALWKGFWPSYCRIGPHSVLTFIVNEELNKFYRIKFMT